MLVSTSLPFSEKLNVWVGLLAMMVSVASIPWCTLEYFFTQSYLEDHPARGFMLTVTEVIIYEDTDMNTVDFRTNKNILFLSLLRTPFH